MLRKRQYLAPQIRSMNNRFHSEAKLPRSYDYPLANHIATNKSSANHEVPLLSRLYPSFGYFWKIFPPRGLKYSLLSTAVLLSIYHVYTPHILLRAGAVGGRPDLLPANATPPRWSLSDPGQQPEHLHVVNRLAFCKLRHKICSLSFNS